jgi:hypothetical protein
MLDLAALALRPELHDRLAGDVCAPITENAEPTLVLENGRLIGAMADRRAGMVPGQLQVA